ncbi:unnamed protein product, partial [Rotaria sp. Silwood1]
MVTRPPKITARTVTDLTTITETTVINPTTIAT